jgi:hypothetical protein
MRTRAALQLEILALRHLLQVCLPETPYALMMLNLPTEPNRLCSAMMSVLLSLLAMLRGCVRSRAALHLEILALHHQLHVLQR